MPDSESRVSKNSIYESHNNGLVFNGDNNRLVYQMGTQGDYLGFPSDHPPLSGVMHFSVPQYVDMGLPGDQGAPPVDRFELSIDAFHGGARTGAENQIHYPYLPMPPPVQPWEWPPASVSPLLPPVVTRTPPSKTHQCDKFDDEGKACRSFFAHRKDLNRHVRSVHATGNDPFYRCRCGKEDMRKDNHIRHLRGCGREDRVRKDAYLRHLRGSQWKPKYPVYLCKCKEHCADKNAHWNHVQDCQFGFGQRGRPCASQL